MNLRSLPSPTTMYAENFYELSGGLNLAALDCDLKNGESPEIKNLVWERGGLRCRPGQTLMCDTAAGRGFSCIDAWGTGFFHIGDCIYTGTAGTESVTLEKLIEGIPENRGSFFMYRGRLYYKNDGAYIEITNENGKFEAAPVSVYTPVTVINADPENGAGDMYQPENRLSPRKTVRYNAKGGSDFILPVQSASIVSVKAATDSSFRMKELIMSTAQLTADPIEWNSAWDGDFVFWPQSGHVLFKEAPYVSDPPRNNTVEITFDKENEEAFDAVMSCRYAIVTGGGGKNACIVMGGSRGNPAAYYWNGSNTAMDPGYFPMEQYNLAGASDQGITGFGNQYSSTVIFKEGSIGRTTVGTTEIDGRIVIDMPYTAVNAYTGCDLPFTIALLENNLVFANRRGGVYMLLDATAAEETGVACISAKINPDSAAMNGLLTDLENADENSCFAYDDGTRYLLCVGSHVWAMDYIHAASVRKGAWYFWDSFAEPVSMLRLNAELYHLNRPGRITKLSRCFTDFGEAIEKIYRFPALNFGSADRLKYIDSVILRVSPETDAETSLTYVTDTGDREEPIPIWTPRWTLIPRNLSYRCLDVPRFAKTVRRRPGVYGVREFSVRLHNNRAGCDMSVLSARIFYRLQGRYR